MKGEFSEGFNQLHIFMKGCVAQLIKKTTNKGTLNAYYYYFYF
jgi:hypothetical protein